MIIVPNIHMKKNNYRFSYSTRQQKAIERHSGKHSFIARDIQRIQEEQLLKHQRRNLFEQEYEDTEKSNKSFIFLFKKYSFLFSCSGKSSRGSSCSN